ncbi:Uncharacterized protein FKW44_019052, partial [Caligus rogercresseyi]
DLRIWVYIDTKTSENCVGLVVQPSMRALEMTQRVLQQTNRESASTSHFLHEVVLEGSLERPLHHSELMLDVNLRWGSWSPEDRKNNALLLKKNSFYEEALSRAIPPLNFYVEAHFGENRARSKFNKYLFSMSNAKVTYYKIGGGTEMGSWPIEDLKWYMGSEERRKSPCKLNITFIEKDVPVCRSKERPYFGHTIAFEQAEDFISWIAAMLVAEHPNNVCVPASLILLENNERKID